MQQEVTKRSFCNGDGWRFVDSIRLGVSAYFLAGELDVQTRCLEQWCHFFLEIPNFVLSNFFSMEILLAMKLAMSPGLERHSCPWCCNSDNSTQYYQGRWKYLLLHQPAIVESLDIV